MKRNSVFSWSFFDDEIHKKTLNLKNKYKLEFSLEFKTRYSSDCPFVSLIPFKYIPLFFWSSLLNHIEKPQSWNGNSFQSWGSF